VQTKAMNHIARGDLDGAADSRRAAAGERLLAMPYYLSPGWLRVHPTFDPIRNHPRFKRLAGEGG
jgi:hypothetical protein